MDNIQHKYATVNGIKMHYVEAGEGKPVILMHGFPEFWYSWRFQIPVLAKKYRVIAVDMRGYNESEKPEDVSAYQADEIAKDIVALIKHLGYDKAYIVSHDWGGAIAWHMAQHYPEVMEKLVVMNCPLPNVLLKRLKSSFTQLKKSWYMFFFQIPGLPEWNMGRNLEKTFKAAFRGWAYNKEAFPQEVIDKYVEAYSKPRAITGPLNYYRASMRAVFGGKKTKSKFPITVPTMVLWGENDKALGKDLTYGMEKYFSNHYEIKYLKDCSHWTQQDKPEEVNKELLAYLD